MVTDLSSRYKERGGAVESSSLFVVGWCIYFGTTVSL